MITVVFVTAFGVFTILNYLQQREVDELTECVRLLKERVEKLEQEQKD